MENIYGVQGIGSVQEGVQPGALRRPGLYQSFSRQGQDTVVISGKQKKAGDGKFSLLTAGKKFIKGVVSPITMLVQHPLKAAAVIAGGLALAAIAPVTVPLMALGFGAFSVYQAARGTMNAASRYAAGDYDGAENAFEDIGAGVSGTALSVAGLRGSAAVAAETRATAAALKEGASIAEATRAGMAAAQKAKSMTLGQAFREHLSLLKDKQALMHGFKPSTLVQNARLTLEKIKSIPRAIKERQAFARMTDTELQAKFEADFAKVFDEMGIPAEHRPRIIMDTEGKLPQNFVGGYVPNEHAIRISPKLIRKQFMPAERFVPHEARHAQRSVLRAGLTPDEIQAAVNQEILRGVTSGDTGHILKGGGILGPDIIAPPKMTPGMRQEIARLLEREILPNAGEWHASLYARGSESLKANVNTQKMAELEATVGRIIDQAPDFIAQYKGGREEAMTHVLDFLEAQSFRSAHMPGQIGIPNYGEVGQVAEAIRKAGLSDTQRAEAVKSVGEVLTTLEANVRAAGSKIIPGLPSNDAMMQYAFSPEEILARNTAAEAQLKGVWDEMAGLLDAKKPTEILRLRRLLAQENALTAELQANELGQQLLSLRNKIALNPDSADLVAQAQQLEQQLKHTVGQTRAVELPIGL